jgi:hypothetical protein
MHSDNIAAKSVKQERLRKIVKLQLVIDSDCHFRFLCNASLKNLMMSMPSACYAIVKLHLSAMTSDVSHQKYGNVWRKFFPIKLRLVLIWDFCFELTKPL